MPEHIDKRLCTHIVYGFAVLNPTTLRIRAHDSWVDFDKEFYKNVTALKGGRAGRKVSLALGGWNDSKGDKYSRLVNDPKARRYVPRIYLLEDCYSSSQSAPTFLVYQVDLIFFEGLDLEKAGCKQQGHCYSKREEARLLQIQT